MRWAAGALSLWLLAAPLQAQTAPVLDRRNAEITNEIACECAKSGIEEVIYVQKNGEMVDLSKDATDHSTNVDYEGLEKFIASNDEIIHYHCHPPVTEQEVIGNIEALHEQGDINETQYLSYVSRKEEIKEMLKFIDLVHSDQDVGMMIQVAHYFYTKHPDGKLSFRTVSITEPEMFVTQYDMKPALLATVNAIVQMEKDNGLWSMRPDSISEYEFSAKLLSFNEEVLNAVFQYRTTQDTFVGQYWDFYELFHAHASKAGAPPINEFIDFLNKNTNVTITPLQMPYK